jgi:hypothetical protein
MLPAPSRSITARSVDWQQRALSSTARSACEEAPCLTALQAAAVHITACFSRCASSFPHPKGWHSGLQAGQAHPLLSIYRGVRKYLAPKIPKAQGTREASRPALGANLCHPGRLAPPLKRYCLAIPVRRGVRLAHPAWAGSDQEAENAIPAARRNSCAGRQWQDPLRARAAITCDLIYPHRQLSCEGVSQFDSGNGISAGRARARSTKGSMPQRCSSVLTPTRAIVTP